MAGPINGFCDLGFHEDFTSFEFATRIFNKQACSLLLHAFYTTGTRIHVFFLLNSELIV